MIEVGEEGLAELDDRLPGRFLPEG